MSQDGGYYVLRSPKNQEASEFEYRVGYDQGNLKEGGCLDDDPRLTSILFLLCVWGASPVFDSQKQAKLYARSLKRQFAQDNGFSTEYGTARVWAEVTFPVLVTG